MIVAKKDGIEKKFSLVAWDLLGQNKNGWVETEAILSENVFKAMPDTGQKAEPTKQVVESVVETLKDAAPVISTNTVNTNPVVVEPILSDKTEQLNTPILGDFEMVAKDNLTKAQIKDFLDTPEVAIPYKNTAGLDELIALLKTNLNGDVAALKAKFELA